MAAMSFEEALKLIGTEIIDGEYIDRINYTVAFTEHVNNYPIHDRDLKDFEPYELELFDEYIENYPAIITNALYKVFGNNVKVFTNEAGTDFFVKTDSVIINKTGDRISKDYFESQNPVEIAENIDEILSSTCSDKYYIGLDDRFGAHVLSALSNIIELEQQEPNKGRR